MQTLIDWCVFCWCKSPLSPQNAHQQTKNMIASPKRTKTSLFCFAFANRNNPSREHTRRWLLLSQPLRLYLLNVAPTHLSNRYANESSLSLPAMTTCVAIDSKLHFIGRRADNTLTTLIAFLLANFFCFFFAFEFICLFIMSSFFCYKTQLKFSPLSIRFFCLKHTCLEYDLRNGYLTWNQLYWRPLSNLICRSLLNLSTGTSATERLLAFCCLFL